MKRVLLVVMVLMSLVYAVSCENDKNTTKLDDINIFINEEYYSGYEEDENMWWKTTAGENARDFFPPYEEIQYKYSDINFYVYANNNFFAFPDATLVLELVFDNAVDYEAAKKDIYETYCVLENPVKDEHSSGLVMPACEYEVGSFLVKILTEGKEDNFPHQIYAICENDSEYTIRYLSMYDKDQDIIDEKDIEKGIISKSNCNW